MSPKGYAERIFGAEPTGSVAGKNALVETLARDAATVALVRQDNPRLAQEARVKVIHELDNYIQPAMLDGIPFPEEADDPDKKLAVIADEYIQHERTGAKQIAIEQDLTIHVVDTDTGEIMPLSPQEYFHLPVDQALVESDEVALSAPEAAVIEPDRKGTEKSRKVGTAIMRIVSRFLRR